MVVYPQGQASSTAAGCGISFRLARPALTAPEGGRGGRRLGWKRCNSVVVRKEKKRFIARIINLSSFRSSFFWFMNQRRHPERRHLPCLSKDMKMSWPDPSAF